MDTTKRKIIELNSMVRLQINEDHWIGQVVEIREDTALIKLLDNMHYHAKLDDLLPVSCSHDIEEKNK
jgi:hypothetical protein